MGLSSLLLVERQRQEKAEQDKAALREIERRPRLPEGFDRDEARRAIIAEIGRHRDGMPSQLFIAMQNGLPSLSDGAVHELFCDLGLDRKAKPEPEQAPPPAKPEAPAEPTEDSKGKKDGRRGR